MNSTLPPEAWRSEAFAEDLCDDSAEVTGPRQRGAATMLMLWGLLPATLAVAGAAVLALSGG